MNILITGGTGFIGQKLCSVLHAQKHHLSIFTRDTNQAHKCLSYPGIEFAENYEQLRDHHFDAVINLAGAPIDKRWSTTYKKIIWQSRIDSTAALVAFLPTLRQPPRVLISSSAVGFYGDQADKMLTEEDGAGQGFSSKLCRAWEEAAAKASSFTRVCHLRTGIVLGENGGILQRIQLPFLFGLGSVLGTGKQWMSWIHLQDLIRVIQLCIERINLMGPINATTPFPVTNQEFTKLYAKILHRPVFFKTPDFILRALYGEMADELLLKGQRVLPAKLQHEQFVFNYPQLNQAFNAIGR